MYYFVVFEVFRIFTLSFCEKEPVVFETELNKKRCDFIIVWHYKVAERRKNKKDETLCYIPD